MGTTLNSSANVPRSPEAEALRDKIMKSLAKRDEGNNR
jgi:hypothetical protein